MKAIRIEAHGGPDALRYGDAPDPVPGPGQVLIRVEAAGLNFIEVYQRSGHYKVALPAVPGSEAAGTIVAVGAAVNGFRPGDRVVSQNVLGAYAELAIASAERIVKLPEGVNTHQGAAAMLQGMTAHYLTHSTFPLAPGDTCLIHAAAGGVGLMLVQMAKMRGARVIGTVSTRAKATLARDMGADEVILYSEEDFAQAVRRFTAGAGVQVVYDSVGHATFEKGLECLAPRGMMALFGQSSGPVGPIDPQVLSRRGSLFLTRPTLQHYVATRLELLERAEAVLGWVRGGRLILRISRELPLSRAAEAHRELESRITTGKVLLIPGA
jgi:NADPH:quinone reductase